MFSKAAQQVLKPANPPMSGPEMLLRSMGLGEMLDTIKSIAASPIAAKLVNEGALERIVKFAEQGDEIVASLKRIEELLASGTPVKPGSGSETGECAGSALAETPLERNQSD